MSPKTKKVAIGLPVYNGEKFIGEALVSLLGQTYNAFELIISDNASTDRTGQICEEFAKRDSRIRYIRQPDNLGAIPNFNYVFEVSDCDYFKWAAVDDLCDPTYLEKAVRILDDHPEVVWCHSQSSHIDAAGQLLVDPDSLDVSYCERDSRFASTRFKAVLLGKNGCLDSYGLIRNSALRSTPLFLSHYGPEKVLMAELALLGSYREIPETLFFARVIPEGSGNRKTAAEQQAFADTRAHPRFSFPRARFLQGYLAAISRVTPSPMVALQCRFAVLQWLLQVSKWHSVILKTLGGRGVGAGNVERVKRIQQDNAAERTARQSVMDIK
jgi:glycosyltransferase involved in cell wall biosynthesis